MDALFICLWLACGLSSVTLMFGGTFYASARCVALGGLLGAIYAGILAHIGGLL